MLILVGAVFLAVEAVTAKKTDGPRVSGLKDLSMKDALLIGIFQLVAAVFPGTSRSGATIIGGLAIGVSRTAAAEFTFILAIPVMAGASLLKILKFGLNFSPEEAAILLTGMAVAFLVSILVIRFLMQYIRRHNFRVFAWYRIALGALVLLYFASTGNLFRIQK